MGLKQVYYTLRCSGQHLCNIDVYNFVSTYGCVLSKFVSLRWMIVVFFVPNSNVECLDSVHLQYASHFVVLCSCFLFYKEAHTKHSKLLKGNFSLLPVLEIPSPIKIRNRASKLCFCNSKYFRKKSYETTCFTKFRDSVDWL